VAVPADEAMRSGAPRDHDRGTAGAAAQSSAHTASALSPTRHIFFILAVSAVMMSSIDTTIVAVAVPQLTTALDAPLLYVGWTITAYQLVQVIMLPLAGKLSDSFGRKRVFLFCVATFTISSLLCGLAPSIWFLVGARALQAIGGGGLMPSAVGVISDHYRERRAQARGLFSSVLPLGAIIGPNVGGYILEHWSWREMFFVNLPIGVVVFIGAWLLLSPDQELTSRHIDFQGVALYAGAIALLLATMTAAGDDPDLWHTPYLWIAVVVSIGLLVLFLRHIKHADDPVMDYHLVAHQPFLAANLYNIVLGACVFGISSFIPIYAVSHYGMSTMLSGTVLTPRAIVMSVSAILASMWIIKTGYRMPMLFGILAISAMLFLLGMGWTEAYIGSTRIDGFWLLASALVVGGLGMGISKPASNNASLDLAPDRAAALTGVRGMFRLTGGVLSVAAVVLALTFFPDRGYGLSVIFMFLSVVVLLAVPLALMIPDKAGERYRRSREALATATTTTPAASSSESSTVAGAR
jgi:EmrB/QacA subfamily drug resistance transporter